jgi:ribosomal protein S18 acetylase RimI-like enzyme
MQSTHNSLELPQQLNLVRLTSEDWPIWRSLRLRALTEAPYAFGSKLADWQGAGDLEARWRERLASVPFNLAAVLNNCPVGMVSATEPDLNRTVELISLWVAPSGRGRGVGDCLVEAVVQWAAEQKAVRLALDVREGNQHATKLYLRHCFLESRKLVPRSPEDTPEYRFVRNLASREAR